MITVTALQLQSGDRIEDREEVRRVGWYLDPDDDQAPNQVLVIDTEGQEYLFAPGDKLQVIRAA